MLLIINNHIIKLKRYLSLDTSLMILCGYRCDCDIDVNVLDNEIINDINIYNGSNYYEYNKCSIIDIDKDHISFVWKEINWDKNLERKLKLNI